jgi:glycosyltransferase involved in cell wall biosynthesis
MNYPLRILVLTKRQYTNRDLLDDRFGRIHELPLTLAIRGHRVWGLCLSYKKKPEGKTLDGPVVWESVNAGPLKITGLLRFILRAASLAPQADIIWACSDSFYGIIGYWLSRRFHIPLVFDLYDNFEYFLVGRIPLIRDFYRRVLRKSDAVTCVSRPLARLVQSYGRNGPVHVLENGVPKDLFKPLDKVLCRKALHLPQDGRIVGTAGAIFRNRGIMTLFKAFERLESKHQDLNLALAGPRDVEIPSHPRVHDMGTLSYENIPHFLSALDIGVICNRQDAFGSYCFPQKAREMMACGVPLVAARVGSMEGLLADHSSWLFKPEDESDLARAIEHRLNDRSTEYGRIPSWADLGEALEALLLQLLSEKTSSL